MPRWACAGTLAPMSAPAVTAAMMRAAGVVRRVLIGIAVPVMRSAWHQLSCGHSSVALVVRPSTVNAVKITSWLRARRRQRSSARMRRQRGGVCANIKGNGMKAQRHKDEMLDVARRLVDALGAQRRAAVHGDGRDGGGGAHRGRPAAGSSTWRSDSRRRRRRRARSPPRGRRSRPDDCATPRRSAFPALRARIARHYGDTYGVELDPARVVVTTGSSAGFILAFLALFEPGDRVAVALPGYPPYRHILSALGCEPVVIETTPRRAGRSRRRC